MTTPSTHPALTEPAMSPRNVVINLAPTGRGEDPHVLMTVAMPICWPCWRHVSSLSRTSYISSLPCRCHDVKIALCYITASLGAMWRRCTVKKRGDTEVSPRCCILRLVDQYSGGGVAGGFSFSGMSVMSASVVRIIAAIEAAFSNAPRVTLAGSMMPAFTIST
jgi:hypothetical protein